VPVVIDMRIISINIFFCITVRENDDSMANDLQFVSEKEKPTGILYN
jgi:hypothetical protein